MDIIFTEAKKVALTLLILDIGVVAFTLVAGMFDSTIVVGIFYGFLIAEINFILLGTVVQKALSMDEKRAKRHMQLNYAARFTLLGVALAIPFMSTTINGWCVLLAMLAPKITYTTIGIMGFIPKKGGKD